VDHVSLTGPCADQGLSPTEVAPQIETGQLPRLYGLTRDGEPTWHRVEIERSRREPCPLRAAGQRFWDMARVVQEFRADDQTIRCWSGRGDSPGRVTVAEAGRFGTRPLSSPTVANGSIAPGPNERGRRMVPHRPTASLDFRLPCSPQYPNKVGVQHGF
jgi:hypothetical protein